MVYRDCEVHGCLGFDPCREGRFQGCLPWPWEAGPWERCDGDDDNCDGIVDNVGAGWNEPTTVEAARCACYWDGAGERVLPGERRELCNGLDDDCDGDVDEGLGVSRTVSSHFTKTLTS